MIKQVSLTDAQRLVELEESIRLKEGLPFLHGWKWYKWAREFYESSNKVNLLCAANQISKSSTQIRKAINWATDKDVWPSLWVTEPKQFWYLYPTRDVVSAEFETKWKQFLPKGEFKDHPIYGWRVEKENNTVKVIHFNSGVHIYFKTYSQDTTSLQTGTCFVAGTKIETPTGTRSIEDLKVGDEVVTHLGPRKIVSLNNSVKPVINRTFTNGAELVGTEDHPFWTESFGWVQFGDLTPYDDCVSLPRCENLKNQENSLFSKDKCIGALFTTKIQERAIISGIEKLVSSCTLWFGKHLTALCPRALSSITLMTTPLTMRSKISSVCHELNTPGTTNLKSGNSKGFMSACASVVKKIFAHVAVRKQPQGIVPKSVERNLIQEKLLVRSAVRKALSEKTLLSCTALASAPIELADAHVYNIEVEEAHTYFANGILVHNCDAIFADEELPLEHYEELMFRLSASSGYFHMVFTATLGQDFWRRCMEPEENEKEELVTAWKRTVSMYECTHYEDGTRSHWSPEKIKIIEARCSTHSEVLKRVFGKFILLGGRKYEAFDIKRHKRPWHPLPANWLIYCGADPGSGGEEGHPAALCFVGVSPDFKQGRVFLSWRGDGILTTAGDLVEKYIQIVTEKGIQTTGRYYDWGNKDFDTISTRMGHPFNKAEKSHEKGEHIINTLFKNDMMMIYETEENLKLCGEMATLLKKTAKRVAKDDLTDAFRYAITLIPWDFSAIISESNQIEVPEKTKTAHEEEEFQRRRGSRQEDRVDDGFLESEIAEWNSAYGE